MPAKKPVSLHNGHATRAEKAARIAREEALAPEGELPMRVPAPLFGHEVAAEVWRRAMTAYSQIEATVVTQMDRDLLVDYCMLMEQCVEMDRMRKGAAQVYDELETRKDELAKKMEQLREQQKAAQKLAAETGSDPNDEVGKLELKIEKASDQYLMVLTKAANAFDAIVKLDGRVDRKRALLLQHRQSLYLTPRARAGVAPASKEGEPEEVDPMEALLGQVTSFVNGEKKDEE